MTRIIAGVGCALTILLVAWSATFSTLAPYDDEGYCMMTIQSYLQGYRLYEEIHTQYGPAYYFLSGFLHDWLNWPLTQNAVRIKTVLVWSFTAFACFQITARSLPWTLSILAAILAAVHLDKLALEPGHPQEFVLLIFTASLWIVSKSTTSKQAGWLSSRWLRLGLLAGLAGMIKINCGMVLAISLLVASLVFHSWSHRIRLPVVLLSGLPGFLVAWLSRHDPTTAIWAALIAISSIRLTIYAAENIMAQQELRLPTQYRSLLNRKSIWWLDSRPILSIAIGGSLIVVLVSLLSMQQGVSPRWLWYGLVQQHADFGHDFFQPLPWNFSCLAAILFFLGLRFCQRTNRDFELIEVAALVCVLVAILLTAGLPLVHGLKPRGAGLFLAWFVPLWIAWIRPESFSASNQRLFFGLFAISAPLIAYPVSGTQVEIGTLPGLLAFVSMVGLRVASITRAPARFVVPSLSIVALLLCSIGHGFRYLGGTNLNLPGATALRLDAKLAAEQQAVAEAIENSQANYLFFEGHTNNRFFFWTGKQPLTAANPTFWTRLLNDDEREKLAAAIKLEPSLCVVRVPDYEVFYDDRSDSIRQLILKQWQATCDVGAWRIGRMKAPGVSASDILYRP
jgi:hypothetical protein